VEISFQVPSFNCKTEPLTFSPLPLEIANPNSSLIILIFDPKSTEACLNQTISD